MAIGAPDKSTGLVAYSPEGLTAHGEDYFRDLFPHGIPSVAETLLHIRAADVADREAAVRESAADVGQREQSLRERAFPMQQALLASEIGAHNATTRAQELAAEGARLKLQQLEASQGSMLDMIRSRPAAQAELQALAEAVKNDDPTAPGQLDVLRAKYGIIDLDPALSAVATGIEKGAALKSAQARKDAALPDVLGAQMSPQDVGAALTPGTPQNKRLLDYRNQQDWAKAFGSLDANDIGPVWEQTKQILDHMDAPAFDEANGGFSVGAKMAVTKAMEARGLHETAQMLKDSGFIAKSVTVQTPTGEKIVAESPEAVRGGGVSGRSREELNSIGTSLSRRLTNLDSEERNVRSLPGKQQKQRLQEIQNERAQIKSQADAVEDELMSRYGVPTPTRPNPYATSTGPGAVDPSYYSKPDSFGKGIKLAPPRDSVDNLTKSLFGNSSTAAPAATPEPAAPTPTPSGAVDGETAVASAPTDGSLGASDSGITPLF